jgi:YVTN family beta-propeller protein
VSNSGTGRNVRHIVAAITMLLAGGIVAGARDAAADTVSAPVAIGSSPRVVAIAPASGRVYVSNHLSGTVSAISTSTDSVVATINAGHPGALHVGDGDHRLYVPDHDPTGGTLTVIDTATDAPIAGSPFVTQGLFPSAVDTTPGDSRIVVTNENSNGVTVFDHDLRVVKYLTDPAFNKPHEVVINPAGTKAYVANKGSNEVTVVDIASAVPSVVAHIAVGLDPDSLRFVGNTLWVANFLDSPGSISRIDSTSDTVIGGPVLVGSSPHGLADTPDSSVVLVANQSSHSVTALSGGSGAVLATIDLGDPAGASPQRIHITADGKRAYVPNEGGSTVSVIDIPSLTLVATLDATSGIGGAPTSLAILNSSKVYVANKADNTVSVITVQEAAPTPTATRTPISTATARPTRTPVADASSTPAPGDTPSPDQPTAGPNADTPVDQAAQATPDSAVAGIAATPPPGATTAAGGTPAASGTAAAGTPLATRSPAARATAPVGSIGGDSNTAGSQLSNADASGSGGAPSWIWLAVGLGVIALVGAGGYFGRERLVAQISRFRR